MIKISYPLLYCVIQSYGLIPRGKRTRYVKIKIKEGGWL